MESWCTDMTTNLTALLARVEGEPPTHVVTLDGDQGVSRYVEISIADRDALVAAVREQANIIEVLSKMFVAQRILLDNVLSKESTCPS